MFEGQRLDKTNIKQYVNNEHFINSKHICCVPLLLQDDYGEPLDCALTSITAVIRNLQPQLEVQEIYNQVELIAKKYGYNGKIYGTPSLMIKTIINKVLKFFQLKQKATSYYLKDINFNYEDIKNEINNDRCIILNLWKDGRNFYKNHTVLITGYYQTENYKLLIVHDNWYRTLSYIDYDKLSTICSIQTIK